MGRRLVVDVCLIHLALLMEVARFAEVARLRLG
jgi:hypothetical protein